MTSNEVDVSHDCHVFADESVSYGGAERVGASPGGPTYIHFPYCITKCHYCDFYSVVGDEDDTGRILDKLLDEAARRAPLAPATVFVGGGTPSLCRERDLERFFCGLDEFTGFRRSAAEVTVECNPESVDRCKAALLLDLGVSRLSIGVQSLRARTLRLFGRAHSPGDSLRAYDAVRLAGAEQVNVDLIYGAPGQTVSEWLVDLERVLGLQPDHVSAYNLTFEPDTALHRWRAEGRLPYADEQVELEFFTETRALLQAHGYQPYEISNFSKPGSECLHNQNYWRNGPYVGIGPSAVSRVGRRRYGNPRSIPGWIRALEADMPTSEVPSRPLEQHPVGPRHDEHPWEECLSPAQKLGETWWLGLRTREGVSAARARRRSGLRPLDAADEQDPAQELARTLREQGFLESRGDRWRLSDRGLPLADAVGSKFLALVHGGGSAGSSSRAT